MSVLEFTLFVRGECESMGFVSTAVGLVSGDELEVLTLALSVLLLSDFLRTRTCKLGVVELSALATAAPRPCWPNFCKRLPAAPPAAEDGLLNQERDDICSLFDCCLSSYAGRKKDLAIRDV